MQTLYALDPTACAGALRVMDPTVCPVPPPPPKPVQPFGGPQEHVYDEEPAFEYVEPDGTSHIVSRSELEARRGRTHVSVRTAVIYATVTTAPVSAKMSTASVLAEVRTAPVRSYAHEGDDSDDQ